MGDMRVQLMLILSVVAIGCLVSIGAQAASKSAKRAHVQAAANADSAHQGIMVTNIPLTRLKQKIAQEVSQNPGIFDPEDVESFLQDHGSIGADRFLNQRSQKWRRAARLASSTLKWRKAMGLRHLEADDFPCDLFTLGLIFEFGRAHRQTPDGQYVEGKPVIWIRLGALGSVIKHLEALTPKRLVSYAYNTPRNMVSKVGDKVRVKGLRGRRAARRAMRRQREGPLIKNASVGENETINHILKSIAWWLENWVRRNIEDSQATLVLDFEDTDFALASWTIGEFFVKLDDVFPDLFDQIIGFRYKPKLWSLHSPISMLNRIFKTRVSSSTETDAKLKFVSTEPQMSAFMPRVDANGFTMLPEHVSGTCSGPNQTRAPAGCSTEPTANGLYDPSFWQAVHNEFFYMCKPKSRELNSSG